MYALCVFFGCLFIVRAIRRKALALLVVALCTIIAPVLMQWLNTLWIGYLDPFWRWTTFWLAVIALVASVAALGVGSALEHGQEEQ
jgi:hypothetical protein